MSCLLKSEATFGEPMCRCGVPACLKTSFTEDHFGQFFWGCVNYEVRVFRLFSFLFLYFVDNGYFFFF
jgi:hypothetical protein